MKQARASRCHLLIWMLGLALVATGCFRPSPTGLEAEQLVTSGTTGKRIVFQLPNGIPLPMRWIAPGSFPMGSPESEVGRVEDEVQHEVHLTEGFFIAETELSQAQWTSLMSTNPSRNANARCPVENIPWAEARKFCAALTQHQRSNGDLVDGWEWDLPSEAQWEMACRAGNPGPFGSALESVAWFRQNSGGTSHPVALKTANPWGLHDMHGNAAEWCLDWFSDYPTNSHGWTDPAGPIWSFAPVVRGGSFNSGPNDCRSAARSVGMPATSPDPALQKLLNEYTTQRRASGLEPAPNPMIGMRPVLKRKKRF